MLAITRLTSAFASPDVDRLLPVVRPEWKASDNGVSNFPQAERSLRTPFRSSGRLLPALDSRTAFKIRKRGRPIPSAAYCQAEPRRFCRNYRLQAIALIEGVFKISFPHHFALSQRHAF